MLKIGDYDLWSIRMKQYLTHTDHALWEQKYKNFAASRSEGLDKTYNRFQKLISQLEIHGEVISQEDANLKLPRSLPSAWNTHTLIMRNKSNLDTLSMDDLYNNLKVYEAEIKSQSSSSLNSQNVAFVSSNNTSSTNEALNTAHDISVASLQGQAFALTYADDVMFSFFANQSNSLYVNESEEDNNQVNDRYKAGKGAVPPPYTGNFMPPRPDLSFVGKDSLEKPKTVRSSAPIIEDWKSYSEDENVFEPKEVKKIVKPSLEKIEFVNARNTTVEK
nr:hypothetical protein [Tanacetum cinerariifolium]